MKCKSKEHLEQSRELQAFFYAISAVQDLEEVNSKEAVEIFKKILARGVGVNARNEEDQTPLMKILNLIPTSGDRKGQYYEMINLLLKNDELDVNLNDDNGRTALDLAVLYLPDEVMDLLLNHKSVTCDSIKRMIQLGEQNNYAEMVKEKVKNCQLYKEKLKKHFEKQEYEWYIIEVVPRKKEGVCSFILDPERKLYPFFVGEVLTPSFVDNVTKKAFLSRYVFVRMKLCDESLKIIKSIDGVIGFCGGKPQVVSDNEINIMLNNLGRNELYNQSRQKYEIGESVVITQGAFKGFYGELLYINYEKGIVKIKVKVFNFCTSPIEVRLDQIERKD